jgi:UDP-2-acetamido-2,6-beta-L-arabino-hexul-4-ose reductase
MSDFYKIGITGQEGFLGTHLYNFLNLQKDVQLIHYDKTFFDNFESLSKFTKQCDIIIHLAALNRHKNQNILYETNISLITKIINACKQSDSRKHIIFSSSTQITNDSLFAKSKIDGSSLFKAWAKDSDNLFTNLIIPNVFGPFGKPFYNSFIATFCQQLINDESPTIDYDNNVKLIYVGTLVNEIYKILKNNSLKDDNLNFNNLEIKHDKQEYVSEILSKLKDYNNQYKLNTSFPNLDSKFELDLFNTYRSFINMNFFPKNYVEHSDSRGSFIELIKSNSSGQFSYSSTKPGVTRGQHFHTRKVERFIVMSGKAIIRLRKIGTTQIIKYHLSGKVPQYVDMPVWYTHNIQNIGSDDLLTLFWVNEHYDPKDPDTFFEEV